MEGSLLGQVTPGHLFLCCCRAQRLEQPSAAPPGLAGIPQCTMSSRPLPYLPCSHWLSLFQSDLTDHLLNFIFWTINILCRCRKKGGAIQMMFFNSIRERDLAGDYMGQNHAGEAF